jgi:hypothetical protein
MAHATLTTTLAGAMSAPPPPRSSKGATAAACVGVALVALGGLLYAGGATGAALVFGGSGALIFILAMTAASDVETYNTTALPPLVEEWRRKWVCLTCGTIFTPILDGTAETAATEVVAAQLTAPEGGSV